MAGRRILYVLALTGSAVFYFAYQRWFSWILLLTVLLFPWLSLMLSLGSMLRLKLEPAAAHRITLGSAEILRLKVNTAGIQPPLRSKIRITKPLTGESWILRPGDPLPTGHCGGLLAELLRPRAYDYLGLFSIKIRKTDPNVFLVMPQIANMDIPPDLSRYLARSWKPKAGGGYAENHEIRIYRPGDSLNQVHWKLSAKVGDLMLREPMEPEREPMLLTMDISGTPEELDLKFGRLLGLGNWFSQQRIPFELRALTGSGIESRTIRDQWDLQKAVDDLLCVPAAAEGSICDREYTAAWRCHIGGEPDET